MDLIYKDGSRNVCHNSFEVDDVKSMISSSCLKPSCQSDETVDFSLNNRHRELKVGTSTANFLNFLDEKLYS